jgi:predicted transcriptional regulator
LLPLAQVGQYPHMTHELTAAGIDPFDESVYRAVLTRRSAAPGELAADLGCSPHRAARALDRLHDHGLVGDRAGGRG